MGAIMPIRHGNTYRAFGWLVAASLCAALYVGEALGQVENDVPGENSESPPQTTTQQEDSSAPPITPPQPAEAVASPKVYEPDCDYPDSREQADLCAQRRMANAAEDTIKWIRLSVEWAKSQYYATIGEIAALVVTILVAALAVGAAFRANRIARESAERQLRAYIGFTRVETLTVMDQMREDRPRKVHGYQFRVTVENAAATPAIDLTIYGDHCLVETTDPKDPTFNKAQDSEVRSSIGPHSMVHGPMRFITRAEAQRVLDKKARLFIWWRAEYRDVFDNTPDRYVDESWEVFIPTNPEILMPGDPLPSFSFMSYGRQTLN